MSDLQLSQKQKEYIHNSSKHRWSIKHGATRSGKTYLDYWLIPLRIHERRGKDGLNVILGNTRGTIQRNVIDPMREIWGYDSISRIRSDNTILIFGEKCYCLGADKINSIDRLRGASIKYCYGDEIATWYEGAFEMLKSRLDKPYSMFEGTTNPRSPSHWLKQFIDSGADIFAQHYTIDDNPFLDPVVKDAIKSEYSGVFYNRYVLGKWTLAEGLIFPMYQDAIEEVEGFTSTNINDYVLSIDYGTLNAFAALLWERKNGFWYAPTGYYYSGRETGKQKTDEDYAKDMDKFVNEVIALCPNALTDRIQTIIDPSAASFITLMKHRKWCRNRNAKNDVLDGIRETATAMQKGLIKINPNISEWKKEAEGYVWDDKVEDKPVKVNDHYMDATRYFVKTMKITKPKTLY